MTFAQPTQQFDGSALRLRSLAIEGWRGINHSFALVNQHQILELLKFDGLKLFHRDLPFAFPHWTRAGNGSGLPPERQALIDALGPAGDEPVDCVYRIGAPFRAGPADGRCRTVTFMVTEFGLGAANFENQETASFLTRHDNMLTTPSRWSRDRLIEWGFPEAKIEVIPHGVDAGLFAPLSSGDRQASRRALGLVDDETVFLNVGLSTWNKGIDLLLVAFATLRAAGRKVRLILKDQRDLYGRSVHALIGTVGANCPALLAADTLGAIAVIPTNLGNADLRTLFGVVDCYVSPYRAEGFNLPVLEAIACGTPVIATRGGATDDFCNDDVTLRIRGTPGSIAQEATGPAGRYIEPNLPELVEAMDAFTGGGDAGLKRFGAARDEVLARFTWAEAARRLACLTVGDEAAGVGRGSRDGTLPPTVTIETRLITQDDVLDFIALVRPLAMLRNSKVRVGNDYDGGYVLPAAALHCDAVLSIGVGPDVSFDMAFAARGARIAQFDHTVNRPPASHDNFSFYKNGWGAETGGELLSFPDIMKAFARLNPIRALLKFDIEGSEYQVLDRIDPEALLPFDVIVCEFHDFGKLGEPGFYDTARRCIEKLTAFHAPIHLHGNNYAGLSLVTGIAVPNVMEFSFLRRDLDSFPHRCREPIPGPMDRPNNPYFPDLYLNAF